MRVLYGEDKAVASWVAERIEHVDDFGPSVALGVMGSRMLAGVVFHDFKPMYRTMQVSIAADSPHWARPRIIREILSVAFVTNGVYTLYSVMKADDVKTREFNARLGFSKPTTIGHMFGPDKHAVVTRMLLPTFERIWNGQEHAIRSKGA